MSPNMEKVIAEAWEKIAHLRQDPLIKAEYEAKAKFIRDWRSEVENYYQEGLFSEESLLVKRKIIDEAWEKIAHLRQDPKIKAEYEAKSKFLRDWQSELEYHYQQGLEEGRDEKRVLNAKSLI